MFFSQFDYQSCGRLRFEETRDLNDALGKEPLIEAEFEKYCKCCDVEFQEGLNFDNFSKLYKSSGRSLQEDLHGILGPRMKWRISWWEFVDLVLFKVDDSSGGRDLPYHGPLINFGEDQQFPDFKPLFPGFGFSPDQLLDEIQEAIEHLQSLFYEWGCWLREHRRSIRCAVVSPFEVADWGWNMCCVQCGAAAEAISTDYKCRGCGRTRCFFRPLRITGIPESDAQAIEGLHREFMELLAGLGFLFDDVTSALMLSFHSISLANLRTPPKLPSKFRKQGFARGSIVGRLSRRASEVSAARARAAGFNSVQDHSASIELQVSQTEFLEGKLCALKQERGISEATHVLLGPKDAEYNFVTEPLLDSLHSVHWPLTYFYWDKSFEAVAVELPPCTTCGRVFFRAEDLQMHRASAHTRDWAFECPE